MATYVTIIELAADRKSYNYLAPWGLGAAKAVAEAIKATYGHGKSFKHLVRVPGGAIGFIDNIKVMIKLEKITSTGRYYKSHVARWNDLEFTRESNRAYSHVVIRQTEKNGNTASFQHGYLVSWHESKKTALRAADNKNRHDPGAIVLAIVEVN